MKTAIVTGASRGIGRAVTEALLSGGFAVCGNSRNPESSVLPGVLPFPGDISSPDVCRDLILFAKEKLGHIDVIFHNAGICVSGLVQELSFEDWHRVMDVNLNSCFYLSKYAVPVFLSEGHGKMIFTSSVWGEHGAACSACYAASKGAVNAFMKSLSKEVARSNIQVNAIAPGAIDTDMNRGYTAGEISALCDEIPAGRMGEPSEIGKVALFLAEAPAYLTGQVITVDGGWY